MCDSVRPERGDRVTERGEVSRKECTHRVVDGLITWRRFETHGDSHSRIRSERSRVRRLAGRLGVSTWTLILYKRVLLVRRWGIWDMSQREGEARAQPANQFLHLSPWAHREWSGRNVWCPSLGLLWRSPASSLKSHNPLRSATTQFLLLCYVYTFQFLRLTQCVMLVNW